MLMKLTTVLIKEYFFRHIKKIEWNSVIESNVHLDAGK